MRIFVTLLLVLGCSDNSSCPSPFKTCSGTCTATQVDPANCGSCGTKCAGGEQCTAGACAPLACATGSTLCGTSCALTDTDNANCGDCGTKCAAGTMCSAGKCSDTCASGFTACNGACSDTTTDSQHCGNCTTVCAAGKRCASGTCSDSCAPGRTPCNGDCVDTMSDAANCSACGAACPAGEICQAGACLCGFTTLSVGRLQSCGLRSDGKVVCAGALNSSCPDAQLPDGTGSCNQGSQIGANNPWVVFEGAKAFGAGDSYACVLKTDGTVLCAGGNRDGRLGNGDTVPSPRASPVPVMVSPAPAPLSGVAQLSVGARHACALKTNGEVWCWGRNTFAALGKGDTLATTFAVQAVLPGPLTNIKKVAAGSDHTCVIDGANSVWCWGRNDQRQCGTNDPATPVLTPTLLPILSGVTNLVAGYHHTCAIKSDKTLFCWGTNGDFQAGVSKVFNPVPTPTPVPMVQDVANVALGSAHTCIRKSDDSIWCWGHNGHGSVGNNTIDFDYNSDASKTTFASSVGSVPSPVPVLTATGTLSGKAISISHGHSCAIVGASNHLWCWGNNLKGQSGLVSSQSNVAAPMFSCGY